MRSTDVQKRDATRVFPVRRALLAALVTCSLVLGGALFGAAQVSSTVAGASGTSESSGDSGALAVSGTSEVFAGKAFAEPAQSDQKSNNEHVCIGYYYGDPAFQDGFGDDERKSGYAYEYYQRLSPYSGWDYTYRYLTRGKAIEALKNGEVDIVAGIPKTPELEKELLFSSMDMGLDGDPLYFVVNKDRNDLLVKLDQAQKNLLANDPSFLAESWEKYYASSGMTTALTEKEHAWLEAKGSITLGYLSNNLPISGQDEQGKPTGVLGSALPIMEEYLGIPIKTKAFDSRYAMREAIKANEVDVIFPVYDDTWSREKEDLYQTTPLVEDRIMVAYTGDYDDNVLKRVASTEAAIGQQEFLEQYDPSAELVNYPSRDEAFRAMSRGETDSVIGNASILQLFIAEHPEYDTFNTAYLEASEGFSFAVSRENPTLAVIMQEATQQIDNTLITNALIQHSEARVPFSLLEVIRHYALPLLVIGLAIITTIVIVFLRYRRQVNIFNKRQAATREALQTALDIADNASAAKTSFLSNMSHDIRTPLNAIIGMTAIAGANLDDTNRVKDCLSKIASSGKHLLSLINEILDVSKIESGRIELSEEPFDLSVMLKDLIDINKPLADAKQQKLILRVKDIVHEEVIGDHVRLQQIYTNLVSNAIKYTPEGGTIDITLEEKDAGSTKAAQYDFTVKDNGIGISKDYLPHLFEAFSRAENQEVVRQQGTGLGMPIALSAARMMNGDIEVESELGKGSTFTATVFLKIAKLDESVYEEFIDLPVLIVDDDEVVCESTHIILDDLGMKSEYVLSGQEAVDRLVDAEAAGEHFFAVIIDWIMPGMNGVQTIREIRKRTNENVPIIVISAYDWTEIETEARQAGASFFVSKPLFKSRLKQLFVKLLEAEPAQRETEKKPDVSQIDFSGRRGLLAEDNDLNAEVASAFLGAAGFELEHAQNGQEAFEMVRDHEPGYYDCVFMDMQMPVMNGLDATRAIRDLPREDTNYDALPIFAMTANAFVDDVRKTKEAGMNGHFAKPLDFTVVLTTLHQQLNK